MDRVTVHAKPGADLISIVRSITVVAKLAKSFGVKLFYSPRMVTPGPDKSLGIEVRGAKRFSASAGFGN